MTAPTTEARDRKRMLRLLIKDITVVKRPECKLLQLQIRWQGGATEVVELQLPPNRADALRYSASVIDRVRALAREHDDGDIAALFNREGFTSSTGKPFTAAMISWIRYKHRISGPTRPPPETFDFLGLTHYCSTEKGGTGFQLGRMTQRKRMRTKLREIKETLRRRRHVAIDEQG